MSLSKLVVFLGCLAGFHYPKPDVRFRQCECPEGQVCNTGLPPPFCHPAHSAGLGEPCSDDDNCNTGLLCSLGFPHGKCEPPYTRGEGEPCGKHSDCAADLKCSDELRNGRCIRLYGR